MCRSFKTLPGISSIIPIDEPKQGKKLCPLAWFTSSSSGGLFHEVDNAENPYTEMDDNLLLTGAEDKITVSLQSKVRDQTMNYKPDMELSISKCTIGSSKVSKVCDFDSTKLLHSVNEYHTSQLKNQYTTFPSVEEERCRRKTANQCLQIEKENFMALCKDKSTSKVHLQPQVKSTPTSKSNKNKIQSSIEKAACTMDNQNCFGSQTGPENTVRDKKQFLAKQKYKSTFAQNLNKVTNGKLPDTKKRCSSISINHDQESKQFPTFKLFAIDEEEGSGGYGTVYKARRKADGVAFAIKCPNVNSHKTHVLNELKMLERFGGKNFVINYEGSLKNGDSNCLVLEHVEHDRPEVLKKEIDAIQLQWYVYLFRALAGLHKQGVVHRDVKPGNFLFSRKVNKGYLIDFNLSLDLHKKYGTIATSKARHDMKSDRLPFSETKFPPLTKNIKLPNTRFHEEVNQNGRKVFKTRLPSNRLKMKINRETVFTDNGSRNSIKSQGAEGSGITSAKDPASTRTPSVERLREPIPNQGRKELISLVQEALQGENIECINALTIKRKRIAAPPANIDGKFFNPTPLPIHASGLLTGWAGLLNDRGDKKHKREGPCVGTKSFRAPEVLFRSLHQGPKVDVWSAGVTLLYMIIGRAPFAGEPDQNIKEITTLRGSEDLWEVAKLHNCDTSFPMELHDVKYLSSMKLEDWCIQNTRRPHFLKDIPKSLIDLVDKCLTVNPRLRISAKEALRHDFFGPCHNALRKHRLLRQGQSLDLGSTVLVDEHRGCEAVL